MAKTTALVKANGSFENRPPANGTDYQLEELQKLVGGYIQIVGTPQGKILVVDEEGLINNKPYNLAASDIAGKTIVGDALYCEPEMVK